MIGEMPAVVPGMAYFPGTGPAGKTCAGCKFKGYYRTSERATRDERGELVHKTYRSSGCGKFRQLTNRHGPSFSGESRACKYFEAIEIEKADPEYDGQKDLAGSINDGLGAVRERVAAGGEGWSPKQKAE